MQAASQQSRLVIHSFQRCIPKLNISADRDQQLATREPVLRRPVGLEAKQSQAVHAASSSLGACLSTTQVSYIYSSASVQYTR